MLNKAEIQKRNGSGCGNSFHSLFNSDVAFYSRITNYYSPPFIHVKIGFKNKSMFNAISVNKPKGIHMMTLSDKQADHYSIIQISVDKDTHKKIQDMCNDFLTRKDYYKFSTLKMSGLNGYWREKFFLGSMPYPDTDTEDWMCSELVSFILQETEVIKNNFHPSYISASELFCYLATNKEIKRDTIYHLNYLKETKFKTAIVTYCSAMKKEEKDIPEITNENCIACRMIILRLENPLPTVSVKVATSTDKPLRHTSRQSNPRPKHTLGMMEYHPNHKYDPLKVSSLSQYVNQR